MQKYLKTINGLPRPAKLFLAALFVCAIPFSTYGEDGSQLPHEGISDTQQRSVTVSGVVLDESGAPMIGVAVYATDLGKGVSTGADGRYTISVPEGTLISFSFIGYRTVQKEALGQTINVSMETVAQAIDDVVVVGYGTQKKITVTGSVASVGTADLTKSSAPNLAVALAGRLPGLTVIQGSGQPGRDDVEMYLRGVATSNDSSPLILIDGVPRSDISSLDPNEIETISVLKDASATAVFGVRGANGVVLVTTRRGKVGKPELNVNFDQSFQSFTVRPTRIHSWEYAELRNEAQLNDNPGLDPASALWTDYQIDMFRSGEDPVFFPDNDRYASVIRKWAPQSRLNINFNGGTEKMLYFLNVGYLHQGGNFKTEPKSELGYDPSFKLDRFTFRANVDYKFTDYLKAFINLGTYLEMSNMPLDQTNMVRNIMRYIYASTPAAPGPYVPEGYGFPAGTIVDQKGLQEAWINRRGYTTRTTSNINGTIGLELDLGFITEGLTTKGMVSYDNIAYGNLNGSRDWNTVIYYQQRGPDDRQSSFEWKENDAAEKIAVSKSFESRYYLNLQYQLNYARSFGVHDLTGMFLFQRDNWDSYGSDIPYNMLGLSARATYAYDLRYLAEVNIGYNGSEQFSKQNRFGFFPAFSVGWIISNENFLKGNEILTNLKLRASYGKVGNDKLGDYRFLYLDDITVGSGGPISTLSRGRKVNISRYANTDITWETALKQNYGIDIQLLGEISLAADLFYEKRNDILIDPEVVFLTGVPASVMPKLNLGVIENKGFELETRYMKRVNRELTLFFTGNYAYNRNKWLEASEPQLHMSYAYRYRKLGYSVGQNELFGYIRDMSNGNGYINTEEELEEALRMYQIGTPRLGDFKYRDLNGDGVIDEKDMAPVGYSNVPRITYGFSFGFDYKGIDFNILFNGMAKASKYYTNASVTENEDDGFFTAYHKTAWTRERFENGEKITYPALSLMQNVNHTYNDFFIMDRSYLRLKNVEIGYTLPAHVIKRTGISRMRFYAGGQNLFMWHNLRMDTHDPETSEVRQYPITKMINFGVNITF